jgi:hydrogenase maturation protease
MYAFAGAHTILGVTGGRFVSLLEPGDSLALAAGRCRNVGTWPVLVGEPEARDVMLSSPIILYDYPQIAPESEFDFCDGTEIDEMLALRVMTLTDEEKRSMQSIDGRARAILDRTRSLPQEHWMKLHGAIRGMRPSSIPWSETAK